MVTLDDKFASFSKLVLGKAEQNFEEKVQEIDRRNQEALEVLRTELESRAVGLKSKAQQQAIHDKKLRISKAHLDRKRRVMNLKDELMGTLMQKVRDQLESYTESTEYVAFMSERFVHFRKGFSELDSIVIQVKEEDLAVHGAIIQQRIDEEFPHLKGKAIFEPLASEYIGGFILFNGARTVRYDATLRALMEDWRERIGEMLHDTLNKAGINNE